MISPMAEPCLGFAVFSHDFLQQSDIEMRYSFLALALFVAQFVIGPFSSTALGQATEGYNTEVPVEILTPDRVETPIGTLKFFDGLPDEKTTELVYDYLDLNRGVQVFLNFIPAASLESLRVGTESIGAVKSNQCVILEDLMDSNPFFLTGNTDTVYVSVFMNLKTDGPTVVEIPAKCGPGTVNDAFFRFVTDMGIPGPDRGKGGKYLILPPDDTSDLNPPVGGMEAKVDGHTYYVSKSTSYVNWLILRGFLVDGKPDVATQMFKQGLKVYPLSQANNPPKMEFINASKKSFNTIHSNQFSFYEEIDHVIQREPVSMLDPELRGQASSIGIEKGKPFAPDARMKKILTDSVAIGNATARSIWLRPRGDDVFLYHNSGWFTAFVGGDYQWLRDNGRGGRNLDARSMFFYMATVNTPAMAMKMVGKGSQYALCATDAEKQYLIGDKNYRLRLPAGVPAKDFWSVVVYDPQTRSELQTSQPFPSKNNKRDNLQTNADGSVDLYFGPKAPEGQEDNWIETRPGKGWFTILRLYGPEQPWFDKSWRPGELQRVE